MTIPTWEKQQHKMHASIILCIFEQHFEEHRFLRGQEGICGFGFRAEARTRTTIYIKIRKYQQESTGIPFNIVT